jgi:hypothetical protein
MKPTRKTSPDLSFRVKCRVADLIALFSRTEGKTLEFKRDLLSPEGAPKAIFPFANTSGGVLVLERFRASALWRWFPKVAG